MAALYPSFFGGPFARIDPMIVPVMIDHIREYQPLMTSDLFSTGKVVLLLGPAILGLAYAVYLVFRGDTGAGARGFYLLVGLVLFTPLALLQVRWGSYVAMLMLLPWVELAARAWNWPGELRLSGQTVSLRVPATFLVLMGHVIVGGSLIAVAGELPKAAESKPCRWQAMVEPLHRHAVETGGSPTIMGLIHDGPEILYRTGFPVVGTPYHRNWPGIRDTYRVLTSVDNGQARDILHRRGVDYIAFCLGSVEVPRYQAMPGDTLFKRLTAHRPPPWLVEESLDARGTSNFRLFHFTGGD